MSIKCHPLLVLTAWSGLFSYGGSLDAEQPGHGVHPPMPDQDFVFRCRIEGENKPIIIEEAVKLAAPTAAARLDQTVALPAPFGSIRLTEYLPQAQLDQKAVEEQPGKGKAACRISIDGPTQSYQRWLLADDPERNRLVSFIGAWRFMHAVDEAQRNELLKQFENALTREPRLLVSGSDGKAAIELPLKTGQRQAVKAADCSVMVRSFYPHYAMDLKNKEPINQSDKRVNPAALVEIERDGKQEQRWVFAKFPGFEAQPSGGLPVRIKLDCPVEQEQPKPDFVILAVGRDRLEAWVRHAGRTTTQKLPRGEKVKIPASQYSFELTGFVPNARLIEEYRPSSEKGAVTALRLEFADAAGGRSSMWLQLGKERLVPTGGRVAAVYFGPRQPAPTTAGASGGHR